MRVVISFLLICILIPLYALAQGSYNGLVELLPAVTFISTVLISIVNVYLINRLNKSKEDVLKIVRAEINSEITALESKMATKEHLEFFRSEMKLTLQNIELKIDLAARKIVEAKNAERK